MGGKAQIIKRNKMKNEKLPSYHTNKSSFILTLNQQWKEHIYESLFM